MLESSQCALRNCCLNCTKTDGSAIEGESQARTKEGCPCSQSAKAYCEEVGSEYLEDHQTCHEEAPKA